MSKTKRPYNELDDIRDDLESLKSNVIELTHHIQENGTANAKELTKTAQQRFMALRNNGQRQLHKLERRIKAKPAQSLAIAFATGYIASSLLRSRR